MFNKNKINKSWTLFLDRDGVINKRLIDDYIKKSDEFEFLDGTLQALQIFTTLFGHIFIVTNQRGVARKIMNEEDLKSIHREMMNEIIRFGGSIDEIYYCPHDEYSNCGCRKPDLGMAKKAKEDFLKISYKLSIMVGDSLSDMHFGNKLGMYNVFISTSSKIIPYEADISFNSLYEFALYLIDN